MKNDFLKIFSIFFLSFFLLLPVIIYSAEPRYKIPEFEIPIDTVKLSQVNCEIINGDEVCEISWIGEYIKGIYEYSISIAAILATVVLMAAGLIWLTSGGSQDKIGQAKKIISGSLIGLTLILGSYVILNFINPNLISFPPLTIGVVENFEGDSSDISTRYIDEETVNMISERLGINCGEETMLSMYVKSRNKVIYDQVRRLNLAPNNMVYFDCSSYVSFLLYCADINKSMPAWTGAIFNESQGSNFSDDIQFEVGDLIGWPQEGNNPGHVYIYIGNTIFVHSYNSKRIGRSVVRSNIDDIKNAARRHNRELYYHSGSN